MASIRKRGKSFQVRGEGRSRTFTLREDAKRYALELERSKQLGLLYRAPPEVFGPFLDGFINRKGQAGRKERTLEGNREVAKHLKPLRGLTIPELRTAQVEDLVLRVASRTPRTAQMLLALIKASLRSARSRGQEVDVGIFDIAPPQAISRAPRYLTVKELYALSSWMPEYLKRIVTVAGFTGLRQGEMFDLLESDIDLDAGELRVRDGKTQAARRTVNLSEEVVGLLRQQLLARPGGTELVFPTKTGLRWDNSRFMGRHFRLARESAGLEDMTFHHLRHTAISLMAASGQRPEHIARQVGHADGGSLIFKRYRHLFEGEMAAQTAKFDAYLAEQKR